MLSRKPWRVEAVLLMGVGMMACYCACALASLLLSHSGLPGFRSAESFGNIFLNTFGIDGAALFFIFLFFKHHEVNWCEAFGFRGPKLKLALLMAFGFIIVILPVVLLLQWTSISVLEKLGLQPENQAAVKLLTDAKSTWTIVYLGVFTVVVAPFAEEFIFRGMLFPFVRQLGFPRLAWFGVSALFALIHVNLPTFVPLFVFALALTWLYERTDNLLAPVTAHALFNAANFVVLLWEVQHPPA